MYNAKEGSNSFWAGSNSFWAVECQFKDPKMKAYTGKWFTPGDSILAKIPAERRHGPSYGSPDQEPFRQYSACEEVWQKTQNNGFKKGSMAFELAELIAEYNPDLKVRVVKVELTLHYEAIVKFN